MGHPVFSKVIILLFLKLSNSARRQMFTSEISPQSDVVHIYSNGSCAWWPLFYFIESHCPVDVTWFPFDKQTCELIYELYSHAITDVNMTSLGTNFLLKDFRLNAEWELLGTYIVAYATDCCRFSVVSYSIHVVYPNTNYTWGWARLDYTPFVIAYAKGYGLRHNILRVWGHILRYSLVSRYTTALCTILLL